ncbi:hypothetical protein [Arthrobacter sp. H14-L1]|uniref:hypothetical protein n=1 Tax=Arthrobacter sp. H14-L1 TaxID=2996697 RepID=UPI00226FDACE|nr:hypothetical protein [Arthrobacter sp. H14-L1]MCY0905626.1 hypothetical protein [Arthrobacter sp. H14-L1]
MTGQQPEQAPEGMIEPDDAARDDLNKLLGTAIGMAQEQLEAHGAFLPVALAVGEDGEIRMISVVPEDGALEPDIAQGPELDADALIADLYEVLRQQKDVHRAAAVICDIHLPEEGTDAIHVVTEHRSGISVAAVQAYTPPDSAAPSEAEQSGWTFSDPVWEAEEMRIWI